MSVGHFERVISPSSLQVENDGSFVVHHSGGDVRYRMEDYPNRNRDFLSAELINVMRKSTDSRLVNIFLNKMTKTGNVTSDPTPAERARKKANLGVPETNNKVSSKVKGSG
jgi:myosin-3